MYSSQDQMDIRLAAFAWLDEKLFSGQYEFRRKELRSFSIDSISMPLVDAQKGIWNPSTFSSTLSIVSMLKSRYEDRGRDEDGFLSYNYRADGIDNNKLRVAHDQQDPLLYFREVHDGSYVANYPVYVAADDRENETFLIALDESLRFFGDPLHMTIDERRYANRIAKVRLHQPLFRARVMRAYAASCAICRLKHLDLLDAAHIISDGDADGSVAVTNGLALCKIHHAAYDRNLLGITPDYVVKIDAALLDEIDGPMLRHGLQDMNNSRLTLPTRKSDRPSQDALAQRFQEFAA